VASLLIIFKTKVEPGSREPMRPSLFRRTMT
jgi:hypothetical protein